LIEKQTKRRRRDARSLIKREEKIGNLLFTIAGPKSGESKRDGSYVGVH